MLRGASELLRLRWKPDLKTADVDMVLVGDRVLKGTIE